MADHQHKKFTARDIEMYHKGQLTTAEMHAMEKAALDDQMLADALEGFSLIETTAIEPGMNDLQERLTQRISQNEKRRTPVILFYKKNWFRVAAMFILFAGLGFLIYQFSFNQKEKDIAATEKTEEADVITTDTSVTTIVPQEKDSIPVSGIQQDMAAAKKTTSEPTTTSVETTIPKDLNNKVAGLEIQANREETEIAAKEKQAETERAIRTDDARIATDQNAFTKNAQAKMARPTAAAPLSSKSINALSGRITDEKNNPVPYAVISNRQQNLFVAADSAGKFSMLTSDTTLNVEISSVGYENSTFSLKNKKTNDIVLKESTAGLSEVVVTGYGSSKKKATPDEPPQPIIGWEKYFQYLEENQINTGLLSPGQQKGIVELSFTIDKNGKPANIKILNTDCSPCNKEAIRLVKYGPGWKLNGRVKSVKLQVPFTLK